MTTARPKPAAVDQSVAYVYGVARVQPGESVPLQLEGIIPKAPVERLMHGNLVAFVSTVPASQFGANELRSLLADSEWLRERILAHEKTVEALCSSRGVVPFRFCTIYRDAAEVTDVLARHQEDLGQALDRVRDAKEWGVKVYYDASALRRQVEAESSAIRKQHTTLADSLPGAQFFLRKKYDRALDAEVALSIAMCVKQSRGRLSKRARETVEIRLQAPAENGRSDAMAMNSVYLVDEAAFRGFRRTLAALQAEFEVQGFEYELTGPWPAYHFVSAQREGIEGATGSDQ